jgi:hypothetical protein
MPRDSKPNNVTMHGPAHQRECPGPGRELRPVMAERVRACSSGGRSRSASKDRLPVTALVPLQLAVIVGRREPVTRPVAPRRDLFERSSASRISKVISLANLSGHGVP